MKVNKLFKLNLFIIYISNDFNSSVELGMSVFLIIFLSFLLNITLKRSTITLLLKLCIYHKKLNLDIGYQKIWNPISLAYMYMYLYKTFQVTENIPSWLQLVLKTCKQTHIFDWLFMVYRAEMDIYTFLKHEELQSTVRNHKILIVQFAL